MDANAARQTIALYVEALDSIPTWAIEAARKRFSKGQAKVLWDFKSCPSSAQLVGESRHMMLDVEEELHRLNLILNATIVDTDTTEDERKAALAHWETLKREILNTNGADSPRNLQVEALRETNQREKLKEHARLAAAGIDLPVSADGLTVSQSLRESNQRYAAERGIRLRQDA
ncbi:hypothetical protein FF100_04730 [Methylobacterium terricola]|uniref:Uncharacterized protein n=1 Tax=Methylobacterium terricola TaxID=2583531 RepID=A0A5C4LK65_9HYPH|nr:hypothetical protein [Methylobacterium terricola]TNC14887.1 hypothetical protein FF100_04730 [Methylobacterium terricola]